MNSLTQIKAKYDNMSGGVYTDIEKLIKALELACVQRDYWLRELRPGFAEDQLVSDNTAIESVLKGEK